MYTIEEQAVKFWTVLSLLVTMQMDKDKVSRLSENDIWDIQAHLERALDHGHGSGDHWILMACLNKYGFKTNSPDEAMLLAEEVVVTWYSLK